ncbi:ACP S-malonyltransferase [Pantoea sp. Mhis]|uniref:ACP S-malonyltransferase n=1 Tax=Pantoea sp. Mhis TaxID=2576759 RepID=UPI00135BD345|nr:ACP S-malonyltransferase [Pantoea sp. Mhis]MXP56307.1 ACP S-malonyltransferase [Pantoea sp. Mhis]
MVQFAFIFPGQGSQTIGMLSELAVEEPEVKNIFSEASNVLGYDLWNLTQQGPPEILNKTLYTQPALLTASVAIYRIWQNKNGGLPLLMAGHSLGEYSALVCSGVLKFVDAIKLVALRGKLMQEAVPEGTASMQAIIGLNCNTVQKACEQSSQDQLVSLVSFNSPDQVIIAGHNEAVKRAILRCKIAGAKHIIPLKVSIPSHCQLMRNASNKLMKILESIKFNKPIVPVINNVDVKCENDVEKIRHALVRQLYNPVRWNETIEFIATQGIKQLFEIGPSNILATLAKRIVDNITAMAVNDPISLNNALMHGVKENHEFCR